MSADLTSVRVPFRVHQKVRDWAVKNKVKVVDAWGHLAELGLESLELIAESERIPDAEDRNDDPVCKDCGHVESDHRPQIHGSACGAPVAGGCCFCPRDRR